MDSNEEQFHPMAIMSSEEGSYDSDETATTLTIGSIFAFAIMGAFPVVVTAWIIRRLMIEKSKHQATQTRQKLHKQSRPKHQADVWHCNNLIDDTPTNSIYSEDLQSSAEISNADPNISSVLTSKNSSRTPTPPTSMREPCLSTPMVRDHDDDGLLTTDGDDDTITARLSENCVRLYPNHLKSPILSSATTTTTTTTNRVSSTLALDSAQTKARIQEYRLACRPQRVYLDEIVPSDVELGLSTSRTKSKCTMMNVGNDNNDDELSSPSQRDPGIIHRYFGISFHNDKKSTTKNHSEIDDPSSSSNCSCPNQVSISSKSSISACSDQDNVDDDYDDGYYDVTLYQDFRPLGELVDL